MKDDHVKYGNIKQSFTSMPPEFMSEFEASEELSADSAPNLINRAKNSFAEQKLTSQTSADAAT